MHQRADRYSLDELHGYHLPRAGIEELIDAMLELPAHERSKLPGLKQDRADITLAGATVISTALETDRRRARRDLRAGPARGPLLRALPRPGRARR